MPSDSGSPGHRCLVAVWTKGFRVSRSSEEFQLVVPVSEEHCTLETERRLTGLRDWGEFLSSFYGLDGRQAGAEFCVLLGKDSFTTIACYPSRDRHGRESVVMVSATASPPVDSGEWPTAVLRALGLCRRLGEAYATELSDNSKEVDAQLRAGRFLEDRSFDLGAGEKDPSDPLHVVLEGVATWEGVVGLASPRMVALGANVAVGTRHEADALIQHGLELAGYFDVRRQALIPITDALFQKKPEAKPRIEPRRDEDQIRWQRGLDRRMDRIIRLLERILYGR